MSLDRKVVLLAAPVNTLGRSSSVETLNSLSFTWAFLTSRLLDLQLHVVVQRIQVWGQRKPDLLGPESLGPPAVFVKKA